MDPTSLIGTVAAAAQLASLCKNLFSLMKTAKQALGTYLRRIEELLAVSNFIINKPPLHINEITNLVKSIIELLDTLHIPPGASRNRLTAVWTLFWRRGEWNEVFAALETKKSTILLCIAGVQSSLLQDIRDDIANMSSQPDETPATAEADTTNTQESSHPGAETTASHFPPNANERRNRDPAFKPSGKAVPSEGQGISGELAAEMSNLVVEHVEMNSPEVKARQVCGFANGRLAGDKERMFVRKAVMKGNGQMVIGFSN
ncbi:hypothetical protein DHEL01_v211962 [Diaporthe helianthi]|uniref:Fungal N-terminal domain-containing protein n=1 Tax=Diaporthe helianthi TaxID=158607 RepID=A0A2P5HHC4_DIAHE|nr:hypothetical protein DHEL01_v211962 [Diaporthe helianthi]